MTGPTAEEVLDRRRRGASRQRVSSAVMRPGLSDPDTSIPNLKRLGLSVGETGTANAFAVELCRPGRLILATAPTFLTAWQLAERAAVGIDDGEYEE
jgi:hypothetical protein